jgi:hypothetical protein
MTVAMAVFFQDQQFFVRTSLICLITCILNSGFTKTLFIMLRSKKLKEIGAVLYLLVTILLLAIILAQVIPEDRFDKFFDWAC